MSENDSGLGREVGNSKSLSVVPYSFAPSTSLTKLKWSEDPVPTLFALRKLFAESTLTSNTYTLELAPSFSTALTLAVPIVAPVAANPSYRFICAASRFGNPLLLSETK